MRISGLPCAVVVLLCLGTAPVLAQGTGSEILLKLLQSQTKAPETPDEKAAREAEHAAYLTDLQTWLAYYGFYTGRVDGIAGPATQHALTEALAYVHRGPIPVEALGLAHRRQSLTFLERTYAARETVDPDALDAVGRARLAEAGPKFWLREALSPPPERLGIRTSREQDRCGAWQNAALLNTQIDLKQRLYLPGAEYVRVIGRGPITMDFRPSRLNVEIDHWDTVVALSCS